MEKTREERYVKSLERTIDNNHHALKEGVETLQEKCLTVKPEKNIPPQIIVDVRELYKEIKARTTEIKAIQQVLQGKYRMYYRRDSVRDKEMMELGFLAKNCFSKFEFALRKMEERKKTEGDQPPQEESPLAEASRWFRSEENQVTFMVKNLRLLNELDYEPPLPSQEGERREVTSLPSRSLTFYIFLGEEKTLDDFQSRLRLREHDLLERFGPNEVRGVLTHLKEIDPLQVKMIFERFLEKKELSQLKCLLLSIFSRKDLQPEALDLMKKTLDEMKPGETRMLPP